MVKNTPILSALALSLVLVAGLGNNAVAQEYITTQSAELNQAIARAEKAQQDANAAGSVQGKQISNYIGGILEQARKNGYTNAEDLTRVLNDAAIATPLLLGTGQSDRQTTTANTETPSVTSVAEIDTTTGVAATNATPERVSTNQNNVAIAPVENAPAATTAAVQSTAVTGVNASSNAETVGTGVTLKVEVKPQADDAEGEVVNAPEEDRVVLANATVRSTVNDINANTEPAEVPNTGENQNTLGRVITIAVAAIVAMFGAVMIVKRIKKNA